MNSSTELAHAIPRKASRTRIRLFLALTLTLLAPISSFAAEIPERPEKITYPPLTFTPPNPSDYRVELKAGPVAYLVPDTTLPLVNIVVLIRCGSYLEPADKTGLASFTGQLLTRAGTTKTPADDLEERLAFLAAQLSSGIGGESGAVSMNLLSKDLDEGLGILRETLTAPAFQADKLELLRQQSLQSLQQRNDDSSSIEEREVGWLAYGTNFWAARLSTADSIRSIQREDLQQFHQRWIHPENFVVAVSGDFASADMVLRLEQLFSNWPFKGEVAPPIPTAFQPAAPGLYMAQKDVNQGRVTFLMPGLHREHPDFTSVLVMNDILGGGGFTSRIMSRVRSDEGLAYGASSQFPPGAYFPRPFIASFASKSRTVARAASIVLEELQRISQTDVTAEELNTSKRSFIDTFPQNFGSKDRVATLFASDELTGRYARQPNFWATWRDKIESVDVAEVRRVAQAHLHLDKVILLVVGDQEEILKGHPDHPVKLTDLVPGKLTNLPERNPLTLEPVTP